MPSTGTTAPNGISIEIAEYLINKLMKTNLKSVDITELNLSLGSAKEKGLSIINFIHLFEKYIF